MEKALKLMHKNWIIINTYFKTTMTITHTSPKQSKQWKSLLRNLGNL